MSTLTVRAAVLVVRPHNLLGIALIAAASACWLGYENWGNGRFFAFISGCVLVAAGGYSFNDLHDIHFDRIAHPTRPLVTGELSPLAAKWISAVTTVLGILVLIRIDSTFFLFAPLTAFSLVVYSLGLKNRFGFLGNILTAMLVAAIPFLAGLYIGDEHSILPLVLVGFGLTLSREILKDIEDQHADALGGRRTLVTGGHMLLAKSVVVVSVLTAAVSALLLVERPKGAGALVDILLFVFGFGAVAMAVYWIFRPQLVHTTQRVLKIAMFSYALFFLFLAVLR